MNRAMHGEDQLWRHMIRALACFLAVASTTMYGAVETLSVLCPDGTAQCGASASISASAIYFDSLGGVVGGLGGGINVQVSAALPHQPDGSSAMAFFQDDYLLTVTGGSGMAYVFPCLSAGPFGGSGGLASASFGSISTNTFLGNCANGIGDTAGAVTYDVPQLFRVSLSAFTTDGAAQAALLSLSFRDAQGLSPTFHYTLQSVDLPEVSSRYLMFSGALMWALLKMCGRD